MLRFSSLCREFAFLVWLILATFFCCVAFNIKSLWLVKKSEGEDTLQFFLCFQHPCGGIGSSESHPLTYCKFLFTERNKARQNASFLQHHLFDPNCALLYLICLFANASTLISTHHLHSAGHPLPLSFLHQRFFN